MSDGEIETNETQNWKLETQVEPEKLWKVTRDELEAEPE